MSKKTLLVLGAGRGQVGLIKSAKNMGFKVDVVTLPSETAPGIKLADEVHFADISKPNDVLAIAKEVMPDGVATSCLDTGVISLGLVCDELGLIGLTRYSAELCADKYAMKTAFERAGVLSARYLKIKSITDLEYSYRKLNFPLIIKATDLQGSRGIYIANNKEEALNGFNQAMAMTSKDYLIIEEFIDGIEFGAQAFVYNGEILFVLPHEDTTFMSHTAVPIGHGAPLAGDNSFLVKVDTSVRSAIHALGLNNCAVNVDMIEKDGDVYLIELTGRVGANGLPEMTSIYYGLNYYEMIASMAVGDNPALIWSNKHPKNEAGFVEMLIETGPGGIVKKIEYTGEPNSNIYQLDFFVSTGMNVNTFVNSVDCIGQLIVKGDTLQECKELIHHIKKDIIVVYES